MDQWLSIMLNPTRLSHFASVRQLPETLFVGPDGAGATVDVSFAVGRVDRSGAYLPPMVPSWIGSTLRGRRNMLCKDGGS
jgi:hypothetical protein